MIIEPSKSAQEIDRRLSRLTDAELAELLQSVRIGLSENPTESYTSTSAPDWKRRIAFVALAGLFAMSAGYSSVVSTANSGAAVKPHAALPLPVRHNTKAAPHHATARHHAPLPAPHHPALARAPHGAVSVPAPNEAQIRQAHAQLLHEHLLAAQARAEAAIARHEARAAMQARAAAQAQAVEEALAQARAQARAEALAQARADALVREAEAENQALQQAEEQELKNAQDAQIKPGDEAPPDTGRISTGTYPTAGVPVPPGPVFDPNCTPHRGSLFTNVLRSGLLDHVRVGGTSVGGMLRIVHP